MANSGRFGGARQPRRNRRVGRVGRRPVRGSRPLWLELGGQQRLRRLHAGLQVRRQQLQRWSAQVDEFDDHVLERLDELGADPRGYDPDAVDEGRRFRRKGSRRGGPGSAATEDEEDIDEDTDEDTDADTDADIDEDTDEDTDEESEESEEGAYDIGDADLGGTGGRQPRRGGRGRRTGPGRLTTLPPGARRASRLARASEGGYDIGEGDVSGRRWLSEALSDRSDRRDRAGSRSGRAIGSNTPGRESARQSGTAARSATRKSTAKKSTAKKSTAKKSTAKRSTAKRSPARKSTSRRTSNRRREG